MANIEIHFDDGSKEILSIDKDNVNDFIENIGKSLWSLSKYPDGAVLLNASKIKMVKYVGGKQ